MQTGKAIHPSDKIFTRHTESLTMKILYPWVNVG